MYSYEYILAISNVVDEIIFENNVNKLFAHHGSFVLFLGLFVGIALHRNLRSRKPPMRSGMCYNVAASMCAVIATATFICAVVILFRPSGFALYSVVRRFGVRLFHHAFVCSAFEILVGALVSWIAHCGLGIWRMRIAPKRATAQRDPITAQ
ncbi:hypothetical protein pmac_cds_825 [Pandoravirus macleodensis]|uniref:Uncharacterized protein n=1 Tax=Pandoravirus macleodensis TaxID=2107707 RepID=A0A2U7UG83_9VIRU|nr:hypothetical protein pmac_cds_825 [Pandoravirus macleodensis]AVK77513.1 hypothetical protein pmac_cds_825 [Pandoravirus macleodensis]